MTQKKVFWRSLTRRHKVYLVNVPDPVRKGKRLEHYETASGSLIWWHGQEARDAIFVLDTMKTKTVRRRK